MAWQSKTKYCLRCKAPMWARSFSRYCERCLREKAEERQEEAGG